MPTKRKTTIPLSGGQSEKKGKNSKKESVPSLTDKEDIEKPNSGKIIHDIESGEKGFCTFRGKCVPPDQSDKNQDKEEEPNFPNLALNQYLKQKSKTSLQGTIRWKAYLFNPPPKVKTFVKNPMTYFGLDLADEDKDRSYWTHKPQVWENVFTGSFEMAKTGKAKPISHVFDGILAAPVRAVPGSNETKAFKTAKGHSIQQWIMLVPMPTDESYSIYIPQFLQEFQNLYKKTYIKSAYKSGVSSIIKHDGMSAQVSEDGNYWTILDDATKEEVLCHTCGALSDVLTDHFIKEVVSKMLGVVKDPKTWSDAVKAYAFGEEFEQF